MSVTNSWRYDFATVEPPAVGSEFSIAVTDAGQTLADATVAAPSEMIGALLRVVTNPVGSSFTVNGDLIPAGGSEAIVSVGCTGDAATVDSGVYEYISGQVSGLSISTPAGVTATVTGTYFSEPSSTGSGGTPPLTNTNWFVSSVNGSDANDGQSAATQYQTIGALMANAEFGTGDTVTLERGSVWREFLDKQSTDNITVVAGGSGARPILDGADIAPNASFALSGGQTNTYQVAWTPDFGNGVDSHRLTVYEDGELLLYQDSIANCEANPGSYAVDGPANTAGNTIYVHPKASTNPTADGKLYEITKRNMCLWLGNNATVTGIHTNRNVRDSGSMRVGLDATVTDCRCTYGTKHNFYISSGTVTNSEFLYNDNRHLDPSGATLAVAYLGNSTGLTTTWTGCTFEGGNPADSVVPDKTAGLYAHGSTPGANVADLLRVENCTFRKVSKGVSADAERMEVVGSTVSDTLFFGLCTKITEYTNTIVLMGAGITNHDVLNAGSVFTMTGCGIYTASNDAIWRIEEDNVDITFLNNSIYQPNGSVAAVLTWSNTDAANSSISFNRNVVSAGKYILNLGPSPTVGSVSSDFNLLHRTSGANPWWASLGTNYTSIAAWRPVLNQDANSLTGTPEFVDPANGDFTTLNTTATKAATLQAGIEYRP